MINKLILSVMLLLASLGVTSEVIVNDLGMTESDFNKSMAMDQRLPLSSKTPKKNEEENFPFDCKPYLAIKNSNDLDKWSQKSCFDGTNFPMDANSIIGQMNISKEFDKWMIEDFNKELRQDAFKTTWQNRTLIRDFYPDIPIQKSEEKAKGCGLEIAKCKRNETTCSGDDLKDAIVNEPISKKLGEESKRLLHKDHVQRALVLSAYLDALDNLDDVKDKKERDQLREKLLTGIDAISNLFPLLFKSENYLLQRGKNTAIRSVKQFFTRQDTKNPHELSDLSNLILRNIDPNKELRKKYINLFKEGESTDEIINKEIYQQRISLYEEKESGLEDKFGRRTTNNLVKKSVDEFLTDKIFLKKIDDQTRKTSEEYLDFLGEGALIICKRDKDQTPIFHHFLPAVKKTLDRLENEYRREYLDKNKDKAVFDYYFTRLKAGYCFTKEKHPEIEANVSDMLMMAAAGLGAGFATIASGGTFGVALAVGGAALTAVGTTDAVKSDNEYVAVKSIQMAKTTQISEYYKASGYNIALSALDYALIPLDAIPMAKKIASKVKDKKELVKLKQSTSLLDNLAPEDQKIVSQVYFTIKENLAKADPTIKQLLEEAESNPETKDLMLAVIDKLKREKEASGKMSGVSVKEIQDDLSEQLNSCLMAKQGISPFPEVRLH